MGRGAVGGGIVARVTLATIVRAPEPLTRYAAGRAVEARFGGETGVLRTRFQHAYDLVPRLERDGLIRAVGNVRANTDTGWTAILAATSEGVKDWRAFLAAPITMPDATARALSRLYAVRSGDYATMLDIIDRYEATLQRSVLDATGRFVPEDVVDRIGLLWNRRELTAQLQWCQHARDEIEETMDGRGRR